MKATIVIGLTAPRTDPLIMTAILGNLAEKVSVQGSDERGAPVAIEAATVCPDRPDFTWPSSIAPALVYLPLLVASIPFAMLLVNYVVYYCVPPARRAMDAEDKAFPGTEYATQQPLMLRITLFAFPAAFVLAVVGQLFL